MSKQKEFWIFRNDGIFEDMIFDYEPIGSHSSKVIRVREVSPAIDEAIRGLVKTVEGVSKHATHICPNDSITPVEQCILCMALKSLDEALANYKKALEEKEK